MNNQQREDALTLEILEAIEARSNVTQRHLAQRVGVALGLANSYLKRCVKKGLVKVHHAPANRYLYYLTPKGFSEKSRLTSAYLSYSLSFYRRASESCATELAACSAAKQTKIGLYGISDLAEIAALQAPQHRVRVVCVCDPLQAGEEFLGHTTVASIGDSVSVDAWLLTGLEDAGKALIHLESEVGADSVRVPSVLGLTRVRGE